jgi:hypothetical protein
MISLRAATSRDLFWNFSRAEFEIPEHGVRHTQPRMAVELRSRVLRDERASLSDQDWEALREAILSTRSDIVQPLLDLGIEWFLGELRSTDWAKLRVMNLRIFTDIEPSRSLGELASALDAGAVPRIWDPSRYPRLRSEFELAKMHGLPIVVSERPTGPYTLIEGTTRMCILVSKVRKGELDVAQIPLLLGVSPRIGEWEFY